MSVARLSTLMTLLAAPATAQIGDVYCVPPSSALGAPASLRAEGSLDVLQNDLVLHGAGLPVASFGYALVARQRAAAASVVTSGLCLAGAVGRDTAHPFVADPTGAATAPLDLVALPFPDGPIAIAPGESLNFQLWYRDAGTSAFSEAVAVTLRPPPWFPSEVPSIGRAGHSREFVDLDLDGDLDVLGVESSLRSTVVLEGLGRQAFGRPIHSRAGIFLDPLRVVDVDGDGTLDVLLRDSSGSPWPPLASYRLYLQQGLGALRFAEPRDLGVPVDYWTHVFGDVDADGRDDLVTLPQPTGTEVAVYRCDGVGGYALAATLMTAQRPNQLALADLDRDGDLDLVIGRNPAGTLEIRLQLAPFTFGAPLSVPVTYDYGQARFVDLNGDGVLDLVTTPQGALSVRHGIGDGTFATEARYAMVGYLAAFEDHDRDGDVDVLLNDNSTLRLLVNRGDLFYLDVSPGLSLQPFGSTPRFIDMNGDGALDLVGLGPSFTIGLAHGPFDFRSTTAPLERLDLPLVDAVASGTVDYDGDGRPELVLAYQEADPQSFGLAILERDASGGPHELRLFPTLQRSYSVHLADLDGDGRDDVVGWAQTGVVAFLYRGAAGFMASGPPSGGSQQFVAEPADFDGDGDLDVITLDYSNRFRFHANDGAGALAPAPFVGPPVATDLRQIHSADLEGDGDFDLFGTRHTPGGMDVYYNLGAGNGFATVVGVPLIWYGTAVVHGDFDGDGLTDIVSAGGEIALVRGATGGGLQPALYVPWWFGGYARDAAAVDLEGDGDLDLVLLDELTTISLLNNGSGAFAPGPVVPSVGATGLDALDDDGDGDWELYLQFGGTLRFAVNLCR